MSAGATGMQSTDDILDRMQLVMGEMPPISSVVPLDVQIVEERRDGDVLLRKITFAVEREDRCWAWLMLPPASETPHPAKLCLHQTTRIGKDEPAGLGGNPHFHYAIELARRGYVTMAPDYPNFGEYAVDPYVQGYASASMKNIWHAMRAIDLLSTMPGVDSSRIGCIGHSLGGHASLFTAAFDTRIRLVVSSCGFTRFTWNDNEGSGAAGNLTDWSHRGYMPWIAERYECRAEKMPFDLEDILAAIAPRPLFINAPTRDVMCCEGVKECLALVKPLYAREGALDRLAYVHPDCEHDFLDEVREQAYRFIDRFLMV